MSCRRRRPTPPSLAPWAFADSLNQCGSVGDHAQEATRADATSWVDLPAGNMRSGPSVMTQWDPVESIDPQGDADDAAASASAARGGAGADGAGLVRGDSGAAPVPATTSGCA